MTHLLQIFLYAWQQLIIIHVLNKRCCLICLLSNDTNLKIHTLKSPLKVSLKAIKILIIYGTQKSQVNMNLNYFMYFGTQID